MKRLILILAALLVLGENAAYTFSINEYFAANRSRPVPVVYEFPEGSGRDEAEAYVRRVRASFYKDSELINAADHSLEELGRKISGGFILYAVPGAKTGLLGSIRSPELEFSPSGLEFAGKRYAGKAAIITVAANPYGKGACVLYAARSNELIAGINALFHGPASYHIFRNGKEEASGQLDEKFGLLSGTLSLGAALEDIDEFFAKAESVHPDLLAKMEPGEYRSLKRRTVEAVSAKMDGERRIRIKDVAYELYYAAAAFGDGHTRLHFTDLPESDFKSARYPPFLLESRNGSFYILAAMDKSLVGKELLALDGVPFRGFAAPIFSRCSGELFPYRAAGFIGAQMFWWAFSGLLSGRKTLRLQARDSAGRGVSRRVPVIDAGAWGELSVTAAEKKAEGARLEMLENGSVAYFRYPSFDYSEEEMKKVDKIFSDAGQAGAKAMIIDIRGNGGGNSRMGDHIMKYITEKAVRSYSKVQVKISRELLSDPEYSRVVLKDDLAVAPGTLVTHRASEEKQARPEAFFKGKVYLLTDGGTFSSAVDFAAMFRDYECGKIIGYETGGLPICFGDVFGLVLSNSRIPFGVSYKKFYNSRPRPGDDEHGVSPDVSVTENMLDKYKTPDPLLSLAIDFIKSEK